ncbi:uncharacterized protein DDB_G0289917-like [Rhopalosiphum maidis]|uniref:uncharacterized protein DDB_G0289917-like n=1 Tax=Rhopalosiphum maidis TaxID=43146 RepID=UPI000F00C760|nr:uncharacterized protein DDB_G0289917-like [Rhopalosiphum maidis]
MATANDKVTTLKVIDALHMIPYYSGGHTEIYQFISACETIIESVDADRVPLLLKMMAATKLTDRAFNVTRYIEIKQLLLDAFEPPYSPYDSVKLRIELYKITIKDNESVYAYNNRVEEIFQKLCDAITTGKPSSEAAILRVNIEEQSLISYINRFTDEMRFEVKTKNPTSLHRAMQVALLADKNIRTYNNAREIFRSSNNEYNRTDDGRNKNSPNTDRGQNNNQNTSYNYRNDNTRRNNFRGRNTNRNQNSRNNDFNARRCYTCNREGNFSSRRKDGQ